MQMSAVKSQRLWAWLVSLALALAWSAVGGIDAGHAALLRVEPILIDVPAPGATATLTLRSEDAAPVTVQLRVFKWVQVNGKETLEPTTDVVASPPALKLVPGTDYVARIVRTTKRALQGEESYRVLVDQLPAGREAPPAQINLLIRQSIPVFFGRPAEARPSVTWSLAYDGPSLVATARNTGGRRMRVSSLALRDETGKTISFGDGLLGYVLSRSTMTWTGPQAADDFAAKGSIVLSGQGDTGPINAVIPAPVRR
jgi:fimbrial chaperone protein